MLMQRRFLPFLYAAYMLVAGLFCIILTPPFQVADEPAHFMRTFQIAGGGLVGVKRSSSESGGVLPVSVRQLIDIFQDSGGTDKTQIMAGKIAASMVLPFNKTTEFAGFPNSVLYPPVSYTGAVAGVLVGKKLHSSMLGMFYLARAGNLLVNTAVGTLALCIAQDCTAVLLLLILALPMSVSLTASCSQDGMVLALMALAVALLSYFCGLSAQARLCQGKILIIAGLVSGCVAAAKMPYALFLCLPFLCVGHKNFLSALLASLTGFIVFALWALFGSSPVIINFQVPGVMAAEQMIFVLHHIPFTLHVVLHTVHVRWWIMLRESVGVLGWLNVLLPVGFYTLAYWVSGIVFVLSFFLRWPVGLSRSGLARSLGLLVVLAMVCLGIFVALYVTWTAVQAPMVQGVQGRYFLPVLMALSLLPALLSMSDKPFTRYEYNISFLSDVLINITVIVFICASCITLYKTLIAQYW